MTFAWPHLLWLLLVPAAVLAAEIARRRRAAVAVRPKILHAEAGARSLDLVDRPRATRRLRPWLCAGLALFIVALARPQWGRIDEPVFDQAREIIIAIDLSRSMLAQDVKPSRLDRAKLLTQSLLEKLAGERVGLVTFSGTAFLQSPLSSDYEILREFLPALNPGFLPEGGTNYTALIDTALEAFGSTNAADRFLIVLSDGEATDNDWKARVDALKKRGIRVIGLGIGTAAGAMIPDAAGGFVKDDRGAVVLSRLESGTLEDLAQATHGTYRNASSWVDLASVLNATVEAGQKGKFTEKNTIRLVERFQWPLAFGVWCLFVSFCYEFPVTPKPRQLKLAGIIGHGSPPSNEPPILDAAGPSAPSASATRKPVPGSATGAAAALLFALFVFHPSPSAVAAGSPAAPTPPPLAKIVSRLSAQDKSSALDWAELSRETVSWGQRLQGDSHPVPAGPVRDALTAVTLGRALDPKAADWAEINQQLEALLKTPESQKQQPQQQNQQNQPQDQQDKNRQNQSQQNQQDKNQSQQNQKQQNQQNQEQQKPQDKSGQSNPQDASQSPQNPSPPEKSQDNSGAPPEKPPGQKNPEPAFGDMKDSSPAPPPSHDIQKVGGTPENKPGEVPPPTDPSLTIPLQRLEQLRDQDSPAKLFQMMDADKTPPPKKKGKDW